MGRLQNSLKTKKRKQVLSLFVVTDLIIHHKELIGWIENNNYTNIYSMEIAD